MNVGFYYLALFVCLLLSLSTAVRLTDVGQYSVSCEEKKKKKKNTRMTYSERSESYVEKQDRRDLKMAGKSELSSRVKKKYVRNAK